MRQKDVLFFAQLIIISNHFADPQPSLVLSTLYDNFFFTLTNVSNYKDNLKVGSQNLDKKVSNCNTKPVSTGETSVIVKQD